jgi:hypothetical protein
MYSLLTTRLVKLNGLALLCVININLAVASFVRGSNHRVARPIPTVTLGLILAWPGIPRCYQLATRHAAWKNSAALLRHVDVDVRIIGRIVAEVYASGS